MVKNKTPKKTGKKTAGLKSESHLPEKAGKVVKRKSDQPKFEKPLGKMKPNKEVASVTEKHGEDKINKPGGLKRKRDPSVKSDGSGDKKVKLEEMTVKERKMQRKSSKTNFDVATKAKQLWEVLRRDDCTKAKQATLANEVYNLVKGKVDPLVLAHDTARVIECLMICGTAQIRTNLFEEVKSKLVLFMKSKYAKFFVMKILKYGTKQQRDEVMKAMHKKVIKLALHTEAAEVVEMAYNEYANLKQRQDLMVEFYGLSYALFKDKQIGSLQELLENDPAQRDTVLSYMKETLTAAVEKAVFRHSIIHHILLEYMRNCNPKDKEEMIEAIREKVVEILHTKDGTRVALQCVWHGTAKDRKALIKSLKGHVNKVCMEESGYLVLLSIFDCVDDTKLVQKVIIEEILENAADLALHGTGIKVLLYLIAPRDSKHFHPDVIKILSEGDSNTTSKKDVEIRRSELLSFVSAGFIKMIVDYTEKLIVCSGACIFIQTVVKKCSGDFSAILSKICEEAAKPLLVGQMENSHIVESPAGHRLIIHLIKDDKERSKQNGDVLFSEMLLKAVSAESLISWTECNRGSFILLNMIESEILPVIKQVVSKIQPVLQSIKKKKFKGAELLYTKLKTFQS
ncbi:hypothetical protein CHUAL_001220 [Chamberlinius hualienensis]